MVDDLVIVDQHGSDITAMFWFPDLFRGQRTNGVWRSIERANKGNPYHVASGEKGGQFTSGPKTAKEGFAFSSPNVLEDTKFDHALRMLRSGDQKTAHLQSEEIDHRHSLSGQTFNAIGDWADGAENSIVTHYDKVDSFEQLRATMAEKGMAWNQKAVLPFMVDSTGPHSLYYMELKDVDLSGIRKNLEDSGLAFRSLIPGKDSTKVLVFDSENSLGENIKQFGKRYHGKIKAKRYRGRGEFLGGENRTEARQEYRKAIAAIRSGLALGGQRGGGWPGVRNRWNSMGGEWDGLNRAEAGNPYHVSSGEKGGQFTSGPTSGKAPKDARKAKRGKRLEAHKKGLKADLADLKAGHRDARKEMVKDQRADWREMISGHKGERRELSKDHAKEHRETLRDQAKQHKSLEKDHAKDRKTEAADQSLEDEDRQRYEADRTQEHGDLYQTHLEEIEELKGEHRDKRKELKQEHKEGRKDKRGEHKEEREQLKAEHRDERREWLEKTKEDLREEFPKRKSEKAVEPEKTDLEKLLDEQVAEQMRIKSSEAKVRGYHSNKEAVEQLFGREVDEQELANLCGISGGDIRTETVDNGKFPELTLRGLSDNCQATRTIGRDANGDLVLYADSLEVKWSERGQGVGGEVFDRMVDQAQRSGINRIETSAVRLDATLSSDDEKIGYKVWPKLGYDGDIPEDVLKTSSLPSSLQGSTRLSDLMKTGEGRQWWEEHGDSVRLQFDMASDSLSMNVWNASRKKREVKVRERTENLQKMVVAAMQKQYGLPAGKS